MLYHNDDMIFNIFLCSYIYIFPLSYYNYTDINKC